MCDISSGLNGYKSLNADVIAVSVDTPFAQEAWAHAKRIIEAGEHQLAMSLVGRGDEHGVDPRIPDEIDRGRDRTRFRTHLDDLRCARTIGIGHRNQFHAGHCARQNLRMIRAHHARADQPNPDGHRKDAMLNERRGRRRSPTSGR